MKKLISLLLVLTMIISLWACGLAEATEKPSESVQPSFSQPTETEPSSEQPTEPSVEPTEPAPELGDIELAFEYEENVTQIPVMMLIGSGTEEDPAELVRINWDLETQTISEHISMCKLVDPNWFMNMPRIWAGGNVVSGRAALKDGNTDVLYVQESLPGVSIPYGPCYYNTSTMLLYALQPDGTVNEIALPTVPESVFSLEGKSGTLTQEPIYATVVENNVFAAYIYYNFWGQDGSMDIFGDLIYCAYPVGQPENAQWNVVHLPEETQPSVIAVEYSGVLLDHKLYLPSGDHILVLDIRSGELSFLDILDSVRNIYPDATNLDPGLGIQQTLLPIGSYNDILIADVILYDADDKTHHLFAAVRGNELLGVLEFELDKTITLYDRDLNQVLVDTSFVGYEPCFIRFAKSA